MMHSFEMQAEFSDIAAEAMLSSKLDTIEELEKESKMEQGMQRFVLPHERKSGGPLCV
jgi:hypothetical protein